MLDGPTNVKVNIYLRSISKIDDYNMVSATHTSNHQQGVYTVCISSHCVQLLTSRVYDAVRFALLCTCICITCIHVHVCVVTSLIARVRALARETRYARIRVRYMHYSCVALDSECVLPSRTSLIFLDVVDCHVTSVYIRIVRSVTGRTAPPSFRRFSEQFRNRSPLRNAKSSSHLARCVVQS